VEVDMKSTHTITNAAMHSKCGWTPFDGWQVTGQVRRVVLRGQEVFVDGQVVAEPGSGRVIPVNNE